MTKTELLNFSYVLNDVGILDTEQTQDFYYDHRDLPELRSLVPLPFLITEEELHFLNETAEELEVSLPRLLRVRLGLTPEVKK